MFSRDLFECMHCMELIRFELYVGRNVFIVFKLDYWQKLLVVLTQILSGFYPFTIRHR